MNAFHLNLLNPTERRSASPVRTRVILPIIAGVAILFVLVWGGFVGVQMALTASKISRVHQAIARESDKTTESIKLKAKLANLQAEADQYAYYIHGRETRAEVLKCLAFAIPAAITLSSVTIPPPPAQMLHPPMGSKQPPLQGTTQIVERVELRLTGLAEHEQDVFQLMQNLEGNAFTSLVSIVRNPPAGVEESPRVHAFRQEAPSTGHRGVFFDIAYDLKAREFVK